MVDLFRYRKWDLVSKRGIYYVISALMLLAGIVAMFMNKAQTGSAMNYGIDFKGGGLVSYQLTANTHIAADKHPAVVQEIRDTLKGEGVENEVQVAPGQSGSGDQIIVRTMLGQGSAEKKGQQLDDEISGKITPTVDTVVHKYLPDSAKITKPESSDIVSGTVKNDLVNKGIAALILGSLLIMLWIWVRYNIGGLGLRYAVAGIIALFHDLLTLVGMFALLHSFLQVNSPFIAALLTVLGYSIHDTIVIFDRIRENMRLRKGRTFAETVNISLLETMARSVNTILTVLFSLLALFFFGGPTLRDFVAAMLIGVAVGGYSSIFVASQLLVSWSKGKDREMLPFDEMIPATAGVAPPAPRPVTVPSGGAIAAERVATPAASAPAPTGAPSRDAIQRAKQAGKTARRHR